MNFEFRMVVWILFERISIENWMNLV